MCLTKPIPSPFSSLQAVYTSLTRDLTAPRIGLDSQITGLKTPVNVVWVQSTRENPKPIPVPVSCPTGGVAGAGGTEEQRSAGCRVKGLLRTGSWQARQRRDGHGRRWRSWTANCALCSAPCSKKRGGAGRTKRHPPARHKSPAPVGVASKRRDRKQGRSSDAQRTC